jgi:hypothetical protein
MFKRYKILKQENCPCNSGKIYKECCMLKEPKKTRNTEEFLHINSKIIKKSKFKTCIYNGCNEKAKNIISAHAMQEKRILIKLSNNNEVYMQDNNKKPFKIEKDGKITDVRYYLKPINIKNATTSQCFCGKHDNDLFANIEKQGCDFEMNNKEQIFLYAYKCFAFEYYKIMTTSKYYSNMFNEFPQLTKDRFTLINYRENEKLKKEMEHYKNYFETSIQVKSYNEFESVVVEIPYQIKFATYMCITPSFDLHGKRINGIDKRTSMMRRVFITIFPESEASYINITCHKNDLDIFNKYFESIKNADIELIKFYLNILVPIYTENLILNPKLYDSWSEKEKFQLQNMVSEVDNRIWLNYLRLKLKQIDRTKISDNNIKSPYLFER